MRRIFSVCATLGALSLVVSQQVRAGDERDLKGTYAFTLAESCVQQNSFDPPGFDSNFRIVDPAGAMTYGGASDGLMVFDGRGKVSIQQAAATNIFNAPSFLATGSIPLGFGFGPALPFTCVGDYTVSGGKIAADFTCTASISPTNPGNPDPNNAITGFQSVFNMRGFLSQNPSHLVLTDIGDSLQPVTIFVNGGASNGGSNIPATRVCTRATTLDLVSNRTGR
jgi:hypothetical protein